MVLIGILLTRVRVEGAVVEKIVRDHRIGTVVRYPVAVTVGQNRHVTGGADAVGVGVELGLRRGVGRVVDVRAIIQNIRDAVAVGVVRVEIVDVHEERSRGHKVEGRRSHRDGGECLRSERPILLVDQDADGAAFEIGHGQVVVTVTIEIGRDDMESPIDRTRAQGDEGMAARGPQFARRQKSETHNRKTDGKQSGGATAADFWLDEHQVSRSRGAIRTRRGTAQSSMASRSCTSSYRWDQGKSRKGREGSAVYNHQPRRRLERRAHHRIKA